MFENVDFAFETDVVVTSCQFSSRNMIMRPSPLVIDGMNGNEKNAIDMAGLNMSNEKKDPSTGSIYICRIRG